MRFVSERIPIDPSVDLCELAARARDAGHETMLFDDPGDGATSAVGIGRLVDLVVDCDGARCEDGSGAVLEREEGTPGIATLASLWQRLTATHQDPDPVLALCGFAFRPDRDPGAPWTGFPAALLRVPEVTLRRRDGRTEARRTLAGDAATRDATGERALSALVAASPGPFRAPAGRLATNPVRPPHQWMAAVDGVISELRDGGAEKVVLAREVVARGDGPLHAGAVVRELKRRQPSCYVYLIPGADGSALVGASPELLVRRARRRAVSQPMAGTAPRGRDAEEDGELARALQASEKQAREHAVVVRDVREHYVAAGAQHVFVTPRELLRFSTVQHLATTIVSHFSGEAPSVLDLCAALHPTAAVGAVPWPAAERLIDEFELMERGWYAGGVGWIDSRGDGAVAVTLRCGLLWEDGVSLYAGAGVMPDSSSLEELKETDVKFLALVDALRGSLRSRRTTPIDAR